MEDEVRINIVFEGLTLAQSVFMHAVIMPEIQIIFDRYANDIAELGVA